MSHLSGAGDTLRFNFFAVLASMEAVPPLRGAVRFSVFEVDLHARELRKTGVRIKLQEQPFRILQMLLERPGELVTRDELRHRIWPADTFVDFDQGLNNAIKRLRDALSDSAETPRFIETIPRRGYRFIGNLGTRQRWIGSLAVLPLENLSGDPEQEYFADGLTEALINSLAKIGALRVVSRTSAMRYKGTRLSLSEIAQELQVDGIVEGTVLRSGDRVRISTQLIQARTDTHLWAESYDRDLRDVLALQAEVARVIAREIQVKLTPQEQTQLASIHCVQPEALEAYLKGRYHWNKRTIAGIKKGSDYFQQAIERDPSYAAAYAGMADCAGISGWWGFVSPEDGCGRAKAAALKALAIDDSMAEAHASLGFAILHYDLNPSAAEKELQRAIELNPGYPTAHQWYASCLAATGGIREALIECEEALRLDPLSLVIGMTYAALLWFAHRWEQGMEHSQRTLELDHTFPGGHLFLARAYEGKAMHQAAIGELQEALKLSHHAPTFLRELGYVYARAGQRDAALAILDELQELSREKYVSPYWRAQIYTALGEKDEAFRWLEVAYEKRAALMAYLKVDPWLEDLHLDERFPALLRRTLFSR
jgi:TolB-like protein/DNA-binding winged helix-turn-helix (wHTH) protein/Tfp pilus assembly protein PilF